MYKHHEICRACQVPLPIGIKNSAQLTLVPVVKLGLMPLANDFRSHAEEHAGHAPLEVMYCKNCGLAQLSVVVDPAILYSNYAYLTSHSAMMQDHFDKICDDIEQARGGNIGRVLEIGSNNGDLLIHLLKRGAKEVVGLDPAKNVTGVSEKNGIRTLHGFFGNLSGDAYNQLLVTEPFDVVIARHVFCHVDNWRRFVEDLAIVTHKDSIVFIETPYAMDQIEHMQWDYIYHEHLSYLTLRPVDWLLNNVITCLRPHRQNVIHFMLWHAKRYAIHGGAIGMFIRQRQDGINPTPEVRNLIHSENLDESKWKVFGMAIRDHIDSLRELVTDLKKSGKTIVGYGASAKSTNWISQCGFNKYHLDFVTDTTRQKQGKLIPGTDIPIVDPIWLMQQRPDYAILFAWNYAKEIMEKEQLYLNNGGKFIVPVPKISIHPE